EPLRSGLLTHHDHVDVVAAPQAVVSDRQQAVGIRRQINSYDFGLFVDHVIDEAWILMGETVMVLPPYVRAQKIVQRRDRAAPRNAVTYSESLRVLVEHRVDNVDEGFIATKKSMAPSEQIAFQPTLALMLAEYLHHPA